MCGDATKAEDVHALVAGERVNLVLTDPPYGMKCQSHNHGTRIGSNSLEYLPLIGDDSSNTARLHYPIARALCSRLIIWGGQYFTDFLPPSGRWLFWDKKRGGGKMCFGDGELAWCSFGQSVKRYAHTWDGFRRAGDITLNPKPRVHPTQKPVELHAHILEDFTQEGDIILDCFGGSGTTLIAAEITGRRCLMMELSPDYCDIIINRYNTLTEGAISYA